MTTPEPGGYGGSLGYAQRDGIEGLAGGVVGFGFDTFGNFSRASEGRIGGPGQRADSFAIRGSMGATRDDGYEYITGTAAGALTPFVDRNTASRPTDITSVEITLTKDATISVKMKRSEDTDWTIILADYACSLVCPDEVMIGFTGGTGGSTSTQEIRNLEISAVPEMSLYALYLGLVGAAVCLNRRDNRRLEESASIRN